ncbi:MAG: hypothetical protein ABSH05_16930 [Bryobacteraceae bacterium]|jgi:hypothetical protein
MPTGNQRQFSERLLDSDESIGVILSNLAYIAKELPDLDMDEVLRQHLVSWCADFKQDVANLRSKIPVLQGKLGLRAEEEAGDPGETVKEAGEMIHGEVQALHKLVTSLRDLAVSDPGYAILSVLFNESGANMLFAYGEIMENLSALSRHG